MRIIVVNHVTLDGVYQAPAGPDEDRRGGFEHGGWAMPSSDPEVAKAMGFVPASADASNDGASGGGLLFGRRTYEHFYKVWPARKDNAFTDVLTRARKYVASTTLDEPLPWQNSTLLRGNAVEAVRHLKKEAGSDLVILGSGVLVQSLMAAVLVDELRLAIHPLVLGSGRRLFAEQGALTKLDLVDTKTTAKGVFIATYRPARADASQMPKSVRAQAKNSGRAAERSSRVPGNERPLAENSATVPEDE